MSFRTHPTTLKSQTVRNKQEAYSPCARRYAAPAAGCEAFGASSADDGEEVRLDNHHPTDTLTLLHALPRRSALHGVHLAPHAPAVALREGRATLPWASRPSGCAAACRASEKLGASGGGRRHRLHLSGTGFALLRGCMGGLQRLGCPVLPRDGAVSAWTVAFCPCRRVRRC